MRRVPAISLLLLALVGCAPKAETTVASTEPTATPVTVATAQAVQVPRTILATGTLNACDDVMLTPKVDGRVIALHADVGDRLIPGASLLDLDPTDHRLAVLEARRALDAELARLGLTELPGNQLDVEAVPSVLVAEVNRQNAERKFRLWQNANTSSRAEMLAAELDLKGAEANKKVAVATAAATLAAARLRKASLDSAEQRLADTHLEVPQSPLWAAFASAVGPTLSPVRYAVAQKLVGEGEMIRTMPTTNVFRLVVGFTLKLRLAVPEKHIPDVALGLPVDVNVEAYPTSGFVGHVSRINPTVDPATRTFLVEVEVPNIDGRLKAGGFARAAIRMRTDTVVAVPNAALLSFAGVNKVFLVVDGKAKSVPVTVGLREKEWLEVIGKVPAGATVITSGFSQVVDGEAVRIRK